MALSIDGTGNGSLNNLALSANTGTIVDTARAGGVIQVVQNTYSTQVTVTSTTYTDSGLSASITPTSSSNKILITTNQQYQWYRSSGVDQGAGIILLRDSTTIWEPPFGNGPYYNYIDNSAEHNNYSNIIYLDSPATTSTITYKTQGRPYSLSQSGHVRFQTTNVVSTMILMEVVA